MDKFMNNLRNNIFFKKYKRISSIPRFLYVNCRSGIYILTEVQPLGIGGCIQFVLSLYVIVFPAALVNLLRL